MTEITAETRRKWAQDVYDHAHERYNHRNARWDYIVECMTIDEVMVNFCGGSSYYEAVEAARSYAVMMAEQEMNTRYE